MSKHFLVVLFRNTLFYMVDDLNKFVLTIFLCSLVGPFSFPRHGYCSMCHKSFLLLLANLNCLDGACSNNYPELCLSAGGDVKRITAKKQLSDMIEVLLYPLAHSRSLQSAAIFNLCDCIPAPSNTNVPICSHSL